MPKRNRHREAIKTGGGTPAPAHVGQAKAPPAKSSLPARPPETPSSKPAAKAPAKTATPADPEKQRLAKRHKEDLYRARLKLKAPAILAELTSRWPKAFPEDTSQVRPWAIGVTNDIFKSGLPHSKNLIRAALKLIAKTEVYLKALAAGGPRYDLDGNARGEVSEDHKAEAAKMLAALRAKKVAGGTPETA